MALRDWLKIGRNGADGERRSPPTPGNSPSVLSSDARERTVEANGSTAPSAADTSFYGTDAAAVRRLLWLSVDDHVTRLLDLLLNGGLGCRVIPHDHLHSTYLAMCDDFKWQPHPWNRISKAFKTKTTGKKVYQRFKFTDGSTRKVRVFPIVVRAEAAVVQMPQARSAA